MAGRPLNANQIRKILEMYQEGVSNRKIALSIGIGKKAVNRHINYIKSNGLDAGTLRVLDDMALDAVFHKGDPAYADTRMEDFINDIVLFRAEREQEGITVTRMWLNYKVRCKKRGKEYYEITQFREHLARANLLPPTKIRMPVPDYAVSAIATTRSFETTCVDHETGEVLMTHLVAMYMASSEYCAMCCVESLSISEVICAINDLMRNMGGCPAMLDTSDLLKACTKPKDIKRSAKSIMRQMLSYYKIQPYTPSQSEDLAREHMERAFNHLNHSLATKPHTLPETYMTINTFATQYNRTRIRKRSLSREEDFLRNEKPRLLPLPPAEYEVGDVSDYQVYMDGTIQIGKRKDTAYYSVPLAYKDKSVSCIRGHSRILILDGDTLIAAHNKVSNYQYSLIEEHVRQWEEPCYNALNLIGAKLYNHSPFISDWVARFIEKLVQYGLRPQECVRKYENIERMARKDTAIMWSFCETYSYSEIESYPDFVRAFKGHKVSTNRGRQWGGNLFTQK